MPSILIIEDDVALSRLLLDHFSQSGFGVRMANCGDEGLSMALQRPPDLILLDVMLPDFTGYQVCGKLRQSTPTQFVPIVMMTAVAGHPRQQALGRLMGANDYLLKPFTIMELFSRVNSLL